MTSQAYTNEDTRRWSEDALRRRLEAQRAALQRLNLVPVTPTDATHEASGLSPLPPRKNAPNT